MQSPPTLAEAAIVGPTSDLVHRIEIFEADAVTPWENGDNDDRLIGGSVSIDYSREERRSFDLELDNDDLVLEHAPSAFWYDKIIKIFCGVKYVDTSPVYSYKVSKNLCPNPQPITVTGWSGLAPTVVASPWPGVRNALRATGNGVNTAYIFTAATNPVLTAGTTVTVSATIQVPAGKWYRTAVHRRTGNSYLQYSAYTLSDGVTTRVSMTNTLAADGDIDLALLVYETAVGGILPSGVNFYAGDAMTTIDSRDEIFDGDSVDFANRAYTWEGTVGNSISLETITITNDSFIDKVWEVQVGEFMIDNISEDHFPYTVKVRGRDYTKKCLLTKFATATAFAKGMPIEDAIRTMAQNAGITKFILPISGRSLGKTYTFERGTARWEAMKEISDGFGYEMYFDAQGYLVVRDYRDPVTSPLAYSLATGPVVGNLVSYGKTVNDTRIYNKIVVTGESSDSEVIPVSAVASNTLMDSPTSIAKIGERVYQYTSAFITTIEQAQDVADKFLKIHALEEFELTFSSIALPWLEVGEIVEFVDPRPSEGQPTRFLLSSINLPLSLEAMSGNAKRVSVVG